MLNAGCGVEIGFPKLISLALTEEVRPKKLQGQKMCVLKMHDLNIFS